MSATTQRQDRRPGQRPGRRWRVARRAGPSLAAWTAGIAALQGCVALQSDLDVVAGRLAYLESRVEKNEELVTEIGGSARQEVLASRRDMADRLNDTRRQNADMLARLQELDLTVRTLQGHVAELETSLHATARAVSAMTDALASRPQAAASEKTDAALPTWKNEDDIYNAARTAFEAKKADEARRLWEEQLQLWPQGTLAGNAHFWLGELAYARGDFLVAVDRYLTVAERHQKNPKAPAAYLKLGMALEKLNESTQALRTYQDLVRLYPKSEQVDAAQRAIQRLKP